VWAKNDPFFTVEGACAFPRDLPKAELHLLDTGHFALEDQCEEIAAHIKRFLEAEMEREARPTTKAKRV
jgi:pimeloyl-ACP methyl ester carboxylesterase